MTPRVTNPMLPGGVRPYETRMNNGELVIPGMQYVADLIPGQTLSLFEHANKLCIIELVDRDYDDDDLFVEITIEKYEPNSIIEVETLKGKKQFKNLGQKDFQVPAVGDILSIKLANGRNLKVMSYKRFLDKGKIEKIGFLTGCFKN